MYEVLELKFKHKGCAIASGFVSLLLLSQVQFHKEDSLFSIIWSSLIVFLVFFSLSYLFSRLLVLLFRKKRSKLLKRSEVDYDISETNKSQADNRKVLSDKEVDAIYTLKDAPVLWENKASLLKDSLTPEDFFLLYDDLVGYAKEILAAESVWLSFKDSSVISEETRENIADVANGNCFEDELTAFIEQSYELAKAKIESKETASDKRNAARAWHTSFDPYLSRMPEKEIHLLHEKYGELIMLADTSNLCSL
jgi:hypothetical protein